MLSTGITILSNEKQLSDSNWVSFKDTILSLARGQGYESYLVRTTLRTVAATFAGHATPVNSSTPSTEEWDLRSGQMGSIIYLDVKDPKAHSLSASNTPYEMWVALHVKFNCSSKVLKGQANKRFCCVKLASRRNMPAHLDELTKLCVKVQRVDGHIRDPEMNSIIVQSLPAVEFTLLMLSLQCFNVTFELVNDLMTFWELVYKKDVEAARIAMVCTHTMYAEPVEEDAKARRLCGGGPHQSLVDVHRAVKAARATARATAAAAMALVVAAAGLAPAPAQTFFISPMPIYALAAMYNSDGDSDVENKLLPF
ncbi:hypothetical protein B0H17DRAFT_1191208 [Mycena rosella]|uniref:Uncharacterized protein n=1 Tax=Mycena rosella TaxID=1033263 RepID=A0AAD7GZD2_MYCRO|nr:hypothetical protein B0H17DRAFT_1191208 [Mycena rosella]